MSTLISLDPRFPIPDSLTLSDPNHPMQLMKKAREIQNQAAADTKYDPLAAQEGFQNYFPDKYNVLIVLGLLLFLFIIKLVLGGTTRSAYIVVLFIGFFGLCWIVSSRYTRL